MPTEGRFVDLSGPRSVDLIRDSLQQNAVRFVGFRTPFGAIIKFMKNTIFRKCRFSAYENILKESYI